MLTAPWGTTAPAPWPLRLDRWLSTLIEGVALALVAVSPWALGASEPVFEFLLYCGIACLLVLAAIRLAVGSPFVFQYDSVTTCLAALFLLGIWQIVPLPASVLRFLSPATAQTYQRFLPVEHEILAGDDGVGPAALPAGSTLSLYPGATRRELVRLLAVLALFIVLRNQFGSSGCLRRLAWVALANGVLLALFGLIQRLNASNESMVLGLTTQGFPFGPFSYRNYFACYINLCLGLGLGLLFSCSRPADRRGRSQAPEGLDACLPASAIGRGEKNQMAPWIVLALVLMAVYYAQLFMWKKA